MKYVLLISFLFASAVMGEMSFQADVDNRLQEFDPTLVDNPKDPSYLKLQKALAVFVKAKVPAEKFIPKLAILGVDLLEQRGDDHLEYILVYEELRRELPGDYLKSLDQAVRKERLRRSRIKNGKKDPCEALCQLVKKKGKWADNKFFTQAEFYDESFTWEFAMRSLVALFMAKAAPFCPEAKGFVDDMKKYWTSNEREKDEREFQENLKKKREHERREFISTTQLFISIMEKDLEEAEKSGDQSEISRIRSAMEEIRKLNATSPPKNATSVYGKQFYALLLRNLRQDGDQPRSVESRLDAEIEKVEKSLKNDLGNYRKAQTGNSGSLFNTYAYASSVLSVSEMKESVNHMRDLLAMLDSPLLIPYSPMGMKFLNEVAPDEPEAAEPTERSAAARAIPFHLALYLRAGEGADKENDKKNLEIAIDNYLTHLPSLTSTVARNGTHKGKDGLAPYYFYSTVPYAASALRILISRAKTLEERTKLQGQLDELESGLLSMLMEEGLFEPQGRKTPISELPPDNSFTVNEGTGLESDDVNRRGDMYPSSPAYVNPLAGLALTAMVQQCEGKKVPGSFGVISPELEVKRSIAADLSRDGDSEGVHGLAY